MYASGSFSLDDNLKPDKSMSGRREFCFAQLIGALLFCIGLVAGILIGIYLYHGGSDAEVICKNLPESIKSGDQNVETSTSATTAAITTPTPTKATTDMPDDEGCSICDTKSFKYTINNQLQEPFFNSSIIMEIEDENVTLIDYMEMAVDVDNSLFTRFQITYYSGLGYFINSINNVSGNYAVDKTYWEIRTSTGEASEGISSFIPKDGMEVLLNFTQSSE